MTTTHGSTKPDVRDMAIVHQLFRREFALAPQLLRDLRPGQDERREALGRWLELVVRGMHHHHTAEDAIIFPVLEGRIPQPLIEVMAEQHERVAEATEVVESRLREWRAGAAGSAAPLIAAYERLLPVLLEHLDDEERIIVPLIERRMTPQEYGLMGTSGNGRYDQWTLVMSFGGMVEQCSDEDAAHMISHLTPEFQQSWHDHFKVDHRTQMELLREGIEPIPFAARGSS